MRTCRRFGAAPLRSGLFVAVAALAAVSMARADMSDPVVVRAGTLTVSSSDLARRLAALPPLQLGSLGATAAEARRNYVEKVLVPELLYASEADRRELRKTPAVAERVLYAESRALVDSLRQGLVSNGPSEDEARAYFDAHRSDYEKPERIRIWRILVADDATARQLLTEFRGVNGPDHWTAIARERSLDEATKMRGGMLGFVLPDGHTDVPQLAVDPALYAAASKVRDGELVRDPVKEGDNFAIVWRRGTLPKLERTFDQERDSIESMLLEQRLERAVSALVGTLRRQYVASEDASTLDSMPKDELPSASVRSVAAPRRAADPVPRATDRGLR